MTQTAKKRQFLKKHHELQEYAAQVSKRQTPRRMETYMEFCEWYAMPYSQKKDYGATTQQEFAEMNNIRARTLSDWKDRPEFYSLVSDERKKHAQDRFDEVFEGLIMGAKKGFAQNAELYLAYFFGWSPKQVHEHREKVDLDLGDIRRMIERLPSDDQREFYETIARLFHKAQRTREGRESNSGPDAGAGQLPPEGVVGEPTD